MAWLLKKKPLKNSLPEPECTVEPVAVETLPLVESEPWQGSTEPLLRGPRWARPLVAVNRALDRVLDKAYGSRLNPLYRSGTLAVSLLMVVIATGLYLLFFYRLSAPYESMQRIDAQWLGAWMRSLHRYASDAAVVATLLHMIRMAVEGKAWGPRALAWISGVLLLGMLLLVGWTGYVLLWDRQAQELLSFGAGLLDQLPIFPEPISRAFSGALAPPSSFFFMNLFLHVAMPLGMTFALWLHTSRLARSVWFPERRELWLGAVALALLALAWPAPLGPKADPLTLGASYPLDLFYNAWLPLFQQWGPAISSGAIAGALALLVGAPWWWRPKAQSAHPKSANDEPRCEGCVQCVLDCPFEAISMVPREGGQGSAFVARVDASLCVSCGLCVGSCDRLSIGPPDRSAPSQMSAIGALGRQGGKEKIVLLYCVTGGLGPQLAQELSKEGTPCVPFGVECLGSVHPFAVHALLNHFGGVFLLGCPPAMCQTRDGVRLLEERLFHDREPGPKVHLEKERLRLYNATAAELAEARHAYQSFAASLGLSLAPGSPPGRWLRHALGVALSVVGLLGLAWASSLSVGGPDPRAMLRLSWRLPGQESKDCRTLSDEEIKRRPAHMRRKQDCKTTYLSYRLLLSVDGKPVLEKILKPGGAHGDAPLNVAEDIALSPGPHRAQLSFTPLADPQGQGLTLRWDGEAQLREGRALLLTLDGSGKALVLLQEAR